MKTIEIKNRILGYAALFLVITLALTLIRNINKAKDVKILIEKKKEDLAQVQNGVDSLQKKVSQAQKPEFIEMEIRNKLGLVKTGEIVVVLPDKEELRKLSPQITEDYESPPDPNWKKWLRLFM